MPIFPHIFERVRSEEKSTVELDILTIGLEPQLCFKPRGSCMSDIGLLALLNPDCTRLQIDAPTWAALAVL